MILIMQNRFMTQIQPKKMVIEQKYGSSCSSWCR